LRLIAWLRCGRHARQGGFAWRLSFAGSGDVGGAGADMIIGDLLLEVKARANATIRREDVYQAVGYALLDYHDAFQIRQVVLYLTRFGDLDDN
jgi:hypothetical protein